MENIQNEIPEKQGIGADQIQHTRLAGQDDDPRTDLPADPENDDLLGGPIVPEITEDDDFETDDDDELDLGDADGSGGTLESEEGLED